MTANPGIGTATEPVSSASPRPAAPASAPPRATADSPNRSAAGSARWASGGTPRPAGTGQGAEGEGGVQRAEQPPAGCSLDGEPLGIHGDVQRAVCSPDESDGDKQGECVLGDQQSQGCPEQGQADGPRSRRSWLAGRREYQELSDAPLRKNTAVTAVRGPIRRTLRPHPDRPHRRSGRSFGGSGVRQAFSRIRAPAINTTADSTPTEPVNVSLPATARNPRLGTV